LHTVPAIVQVDMKFLLYSLSVAVVLYSCEAKNECLSVRGHVRCGSGRGTGGGSSDHSGRPGRPGSGSGSSGLGSHSSSGGSSGSAGSSDPVFIKLVDEDTGGPDDWMDETYASSSGAFQLHGCATDGALGGHIEPMLRIYHKCKGTPKRFTVEIPVQFIDKEYNLTTVYDLQGTLQNEKDEKYPVPPCKKSKMFLF